MSGNELDSVLWGVVGEAALKLVKLFVVLTQADSHPRFPEAGFALQTIDFAGPPLNSSTAGWYDL